MRFHTQFGITGFTAFLNIIRCLAGYRFNRLAARPQKMDLRFAINNYYPPKKGLQHLPRAYASGVLLFSSNIQTNICIFLLSKKIF